MRDRDQIEEMIRHEKLVHWQLRDSRAHKSRIRSLTRMGRPWPPQKPENLAVLLMIVPPSDGMIPLDRRPDPALVVAGRLENPMFSNSPCAAGYSRPRLIR